MAKTQTKARPQTSHSADYEQLAAMSIDQVRSEIVKLGADFHQAEKKPDLMARLLQLQGTAQPIDKIKKDLQAHGIGEDAGRTDAVPRINKRLTPDEIRKAAKKYVDKGMKLLLSKDGQFWEIRFECEQPKQGGGIVKAKRKDSGNTMIPIGVFKSSCETITTYTKLKKTSEHDAIGEDYEDLEDGADAA